MWPRGRGSFIGKSGKRRAVTIATPAGAGRHLPAAASRRGSARWDVPVLHPPPGGPATRFAAALGDHEPALVFLAAIFLGLALLAALSIGLGLLVAHVLAPSWGIGAADERVPGWLAAHRSPTRGDASLVGSI